MSDTTFAFKVAEELKTAFAAAAEARSTTSEELLRELMSEAVRAHRDDNYDAWFRGEVEQALREADDPNVQWVSNEDAKAEWQRMRAELVSRAGSK